MARLGDRQEGFSDFGGGTDKAWLRVKAPFNPSLRDGTGLVDKPSGLVIEAVGAAGAVTTYFIWVDRNGMLHSKTSEPTDEDETTSIMAPKNIRVSTIGLDPQQAIIQGSTIEVATTITGVAAGDIVMIERGSMNGLTAAYTGYQIDSVGRITAADTVAFRFRNVSQAVLTPEPETVRYIWFDLT